MAKVTLHATIFGEDGIKTRDYETALIPDAKNQEMQVINLYPDKTYQKIEGFGAALTESAGYALSRMSEENRKKVVEAYYGKDGIGYTIGRIHMDSCDFSIGNYCAVESPDDPEFRDFSLERDAKYVQPLVKAVSKTLGKPVSLLAVQTWDSCEYTAEEEKEFLRDYLYPTLKEKGLDHVKLYIWDHNKERTYERTRDIVDETTKDMIAGVAYHWYSGDHFETLSMVREDYPDLMLMHSEGCVELARYGAAAGNSLRHAKQYAHDIIGDLNHGMNYWIDWNLVLDEIGGPNHVDNFCGAPIICDGTNDTIEVKYIKPGAVRIASSTYSPDLEVTAAKNPDGTIALVVLNTSEETKVVNLRMNGTTTRLTFWGNSIATVLI